MGNSRIIWNHEENQADKIARSIIETRGVEFGWRILLLPSFLLDYIRFKKGLILTRKNLLFTKRLAINAAKEIFRGKDHAFEMRLIEIKTKPMVDRDRKGYYTAKIRQKQLREIELLIDHYLDILNSDRDNYEEIIREAYQSKKRYLAFLNRPQQTEKEVIQAAITSMRKKSKKERLMWFGKVEKTSKKARMEEVERIFSEG